VKRGPRAQRARAAARACVAGALAGLCGCGGGEPAAAERVFPLRDVVRPALAAAELAAPRAAPAPLVPAEAQMVEAVLGALASNDARLARLGHDDARALGDAAVAPLAALLRDATAEPARRALAAQALAAVETPGALAALLEALEQEREPWLRAQCAWRAGAMGLDVAVPRLLLRLKYEVDGAAVAWVADALARHGHIAGLDGLRVVRDTAGDESVRATATERLAAIAGEYGFADADALYAAWYGGDPEGRIAARAPSPALVRETWEWIARLAEWDLRRVDDARFVLVRMESWVVPLLAQTLHEADVYARVHAAQVLERRGPRARAAEPALSAALDDPRLGPQAAVALGAIGARTAPPPAAGREVPRRAR
jgi:HEAT repeat protein